MTFSCMFSFFSWNAPAQVPPRGSFIQKCRFAFGEWLAFRGSDACGLCWVFHQRWGVWSRHLGTGSGPRTRGCVLPVREPWEPWASSTEPRATAGPGWAGTATLQPWDGECPPRIPLLQCDGLSLSQAPAVSCPGFCCASSCASRCSTPFQLPWM